jgi:hypothetical protein
MRSNERELDPPALQPASAPSHACLRDVPALARRRRRRLPSDARVAPRRSACSARLLLVRFERDLGVCEELRNHAIAQAAVFELGSARRSRPPMP